MRQTTSLGAAIGLKDLTDTYPLLTHSRFPSSSAGTSVGPGDLPFWGELLFSMPSSGCGFPLTLKMAREYQKTTLVDHLSTKHIFHFSIM